MGPQILGGKCQPCWMPCWVLGTHGVRPAATETEGGEREQLIAERKKIVTCTPTGKSLSKKKPQTIQRAPRPSFPQWRQTELSPCEGAWFGGLIAGISPAIIAQGVIQPLSNNEKACTAVGGHLPLGEGCLDGPRGLCSSSPGHSFQALSPPLDRRQGRGFRLPSQRAKGIVPGTRCGAVSGGGGGHGLFLSSLDISFPRRF